MKNVSWQVFFVSSLNIRRNKPLGNVNKKLLKRFSKAISYHVKRNCLLSYKLGRNFFGGRENHPEGGE